MATPGNHHDALFKCLVENPATAGALIREQLPADIADMLADEPPVLVDATFIDHKLRETRGDRLFEVRLKDGSQALIYVIMEHKSTPDPRTPIQMLGYMARIWDRYAGPGGGKARTLPPVIPLVIYHGQSPWTVPTSVQECLEGDLHLRPDLVGFRYLIRDIGRVDNERLSARPELRSVLLALKYGPRETASDEILVRILTDLPDGSLLEQQVIHYVLSVFKELTIDTWRDIVAAAKPDREGEMVSLAAQEWFNQGLREGEERGEARGEARGEIRGLAEALTQLLETRFGPVDAALRQSLNQMPADTLRHMIARALSAPSLDDVFDE